MNAHTADPEQQFRQTGVRAAEILLGLGYHVIPTKGKDPYEIRWQTNIYPVFDLEARILNGDNIGVLFGQDLGDGTRMIALDVDFEDPKLAAVVRALLPDASVRIGREPKFLMPLRVRDAEAASRDFRFYKGEGPGAESCAIQVLGRGQKAPAGPKQAVVWGIHPGTQKPYVWRPDWAGRNIYQRRPGDWPLVGDLAGFMTGLGAALEPLGWKLREPGHQSTGDPFEGVLSPRMIADARATLESELAALAGMGPGTLRGTRCYELGLRIGAVIKAGHIDLDRTVERLREAMPDNDNAWTREFQRGVFEAKGFRQAKIGESENVDWAGAAKAQGAPWGEDAPGAKPGFNPGSEEKKKSGYELSLDMLHERIFKKNVLFHGGETSMAAVLGEAATAALRNRIFRGAASDVVRVLPSAGSRGLDALVTPDGDFNLADLPTPNVREAIPTDSGCKLLIMDAARCWSRVGIPRGLDATAKRLVLAPDGDSVAWQDQDASGRAVEVVARTRQWALREGYNFGRDAWLGIYDGWVPASLPKGDTMKEAICNFRLGSGTVGIARLNSVLTAPSFGKGGRLLLDDGVLEVGPGEVVFAALGPLHGRVRVDGDVEGAKARVRAFLKAFPFVDTTSESVALSLLFTLAARGAFPIPPGYAIDAPEYGSGKTYLAVAMAAVAGMGVSIIPCGSDAGTDEELAKRFETALMTGSSGMILLDDVPNGRMPNFSTLRTYLSTTRPELKIRRFGKNDDQVTVRVDRSTLVVTGNAIDVSKDMIRRLLRCYLSQEEANEQTGWTIEAARETINGLFACPDKWGVLLSDILTILKHNWDKRPCELPPTQNYEGWSRVVREAVKFTTGVDVDDSREEMSEFDDDRQMWQETMTRIREAVKDLKMFTVGDLVDAAKKVVDAGFGAKEEGPVKELASEFEFSRKGAVDFARRIGNFMKMHKDRAFPADGGMRRLRRLSHKTKHKGEKTKWCFVELGVKN
jgi:hypothetical protein